MPLVPVTDPELLAQLNEQPTRRPVTDPEILRQLNGEPAQKRGLAQELGRQVGLAGRYAIEGGLGLAGTLANVPAYLGNKALDLYDEMRSPKLDELVTGKRKGFRFPDQNQLVSQTLTDAGLPQPEGKLEEAVGSMSRGVAGAGSGLGLARTMASAPSQAVSQAGQTMAQQPLVQGVAGVTGPAASEIAQEAGLGRAGQLVAGLAGGISPSLFATAGPALTRGLFRGGEQGRQTVEENIRTFADAGATPSVGQATERRIFRAAETGLANAPGSGGVMARKAAEQGDEIAGAIERRASTLARKTSGEQAGRTIERGIRGSDGFVEQFRAKQTELYGRLDAFFPGQRPIDVRNTRETLRQLNADIEGAKSLSQWFKNAKIRGIYGSFLEDTGVEAASGNSPLDMLRAAKSLDQLDVTAHKLRIGLSENPTPEQMDLENAYFALRQQLKTGGAKSEAIENASRLPYEAVKKLRTLVGSEMDNSFGGTVSRDKWSALYAALSKDVENATKGNPAAAQAWSRATNYTRAGHRRIEAIESVVDKAGGPEAIFRAATSNTREGATTLRAVMQSLDKEGQKVVSATVLRRLGIANPSNQDDLGEQFSTSTFLTNWNKLSPEAKRTLFDRYGPKFREDMNQIAKVAANLRAGSEVFRNPSGTARQQALWSTTGAFVLSVLTGRVDVAAGIAAGVGGANLSARLMTNPRFVRWLAQATKHPTAHTPSMINQLAQEARKTGDEDLAEAAALLQNAQDQQQ